MSRPGRWKADGEQTMARKKRRRLGDILVEWGVVTPAGVEEAVEHARAEGLRIGEALVSLGLADEEDVT